MNHTETPVETLSDEALLQIAGNDWMEGRSQSDRARAAQHELDLRQRSGVTLEARGTLHHPV